MRQQVKLTDSGHSRANSLLKEINELNGQGRYAAAIQKALYLNKIIEKEVGPSHPGAASSLNILGGLYISFGDYQKSLPLLERALKIYQQTGNDNDPNIATTLGLIAKVHSKTGDLNQAKRFALRSHALRENGA